MPGVIAPTAEFILWYRAGRGRWRPVANAGSYSDAIDMIDTSGRHHGDWLVNPKGIDPNVIPSPAAAADTSRRAGKRRPHVTRRGRRVTPRR